MDCREFADRMDGLLDAGPDGAQRRQLEEHMSACSRCRELWNLARAGLDPIDVPVPAGLTESILRLTSGPVCASARERLCDHLDGSLDATGEDLVGMHLRECGACADLRVVLAALAVDLPALRELEPDARFASDVLVRTGSRRRMTAPWLERLAGRWSVLVRRPRFAWEGSYVGVLLLMLIFGARSAPLAGVTLSAVNQATSEAVTTLRKPVEELAPQLSSSVGSTWQAATGGVVDTSSELAIEAAHGPSFLYERARKFLGTAWGWITSYRESHDTRKPADKPRSGEGEER